MSLDFKRIFIFGLNLMLAGITKCYIRIGESPTNQICDTYCYCDSNFIRCFKDFNKSYYFDSMIQSCYFKEFEENLREFSIDFDDSRTKINIYENTFMKLTQIEILHLDRVTFNDGNLPNLVNQLNIKEIIIENTNLMSIGNNLECKNKMFLKKIVFSNNDLSSESLNKGIFDDCKNINLLDLSHNKIISLESLFTKQINLVSLVLDNNKIEYINEFDIKYLSELTELSVSKNKLKQIHPDAFEDLKNLVKLNLEKNLLHSLPPKSIIYGNLKTLSIYGNLNLIDFPSAHEFKSLRKLSVQYSYHCCPFRKIKMKADPSLKFLNLMTSNGLKRSKEILIAEKFSSDRSTSKNAFELKMEKLNEQWIDENQITVNCSLEPDPFQPCENLLSEDVWISIVVWTIALMGIFCNLCVIIHNFAYIIFDFQLNNCVKVSTYLLSNLAVADLLMSIYLLFIAVEDAESRQNFFRSAIVWQRSFRCNLAGFFGIASSISSALCLVFITFERYYSLKNSFYYYKRVSIKMAIIFTLIIWIISLIVASLPLFKINSYSAYAICLPFEIGTDASEYYLLGLNTLWILCFFFICFFYSMILINTLLLSKKASSSTCNSLYQSKLRNAEDKKLARNISLLVIANIICWGPAVILSLKAIVSSVNSMNRAHLKLLAVFVVPFNSLLNPFLYCIFRPSFLMHLQESIFSRYKRSLRGFSIKSIKTINRRQTF